MSSAGGIRGLTADDTSVGVERREGNGILCYRRRPRSLDTVLDDAVRRHPDTVALRVAEGDLTNREWPAASRRRPSVSRYQVPRSIRSLDTLPRNSTGKVDKQALRSLYVAPEGA